MPTYNLVRLKMMQSGYAAEREIRSMSFTETYQLLSTNWLPCACAGVNEAMVASAQAQGVCAIVEDAIGATHHLFIAITSALQKFRILRTMGGTNCVFLVVVNCTCRDTVRRYLDTLGLFVQRESHFRKAMIR